MASLIAILDLKGKPLIQRSYRDDVPSSFVERFLPLVLEIEEDSGQQVTPCFSSQGINYMHIRHSNLYRTLYPSRFILDNIYYLHVQYSLSQNATPMRLRSFCFYTD